MKVELNEKDIVKLIDKKQLTEGVARKVFGDNIGLNGEFKEDVQKALEDATRKLVKEYVENYWVESIIKGEIQNVIRRFTKKEIIEILLERERRIRNDIRFSFVICLIAIVVLFILSF